MQCPHCGQTNRADARFCIRCGGALGTGSGGWSGLQPGQTIRGGAYHIIRPLSKGGMGALYLAADTQAFDRPCVIKEMLDYFDPSDPQEVAKARQRFEDEARTLATLSHPGIPKIYTYFSENNRNYIVMEYVEGEDLEQGLTHEDEQGNLVHGGPLPLEEVLRYAIQVCKVLEYLVRVKPQPVVHHDIKPANLILDRNSGEVRLVDFGTARARLMLQPGGQVGLQKSSIYGTMGYAPPEQYQAQSEPRSDVYALAATMYHLLTDDNPQTHPFQFPQLSKLPKEMWAALDKALQQDVGQRCTAAQFRQALERILAPKGTAQPFHLRSGGVARTAEELAQLCDRHWDDGKYHLYQGDLERWLRTALFRTDLAVQTEAIRQRGGDQDAGLEEMLHILDPQLPQPALRLSPNALDFGTMSGGQKEQKQFTVQNAGRGYVRVEIQVQQPWLVAQPAEARLLASKAQPVTVTVDAGRLPTRARSVGGIAVTSALGADQVRVRASLSLLKTVWARYRRAIAAGLIIAMISSVIMLSSAYWTYPKWSHYEQEIAYLVAQAWDKARTEFERLLQIDARKSAGTFTPTSALTTIPAPTSKLTEASPAPTPTLTPVPPTSATVPLAATPVVPTPTKAVALVGKLAYTVYNTDFKYLETIVVTVDGEYVLGVPNAVQPAFSPDGKWLAFRSLDPGGIGVLNLETRARQTLTSIVQDSHPSFNPESHDIVFSRDGRLYLVDVVSRPTVREVGDSTLIHAGIAAGHFPDWCQVAHKTPEIVYSGSTEGWVFGLMLTTPIYDIHYPLTRELGDTMPAWSPDCTRIAFAREEDGNWDVYVIKPDGSGRRRLTSDGTIEFAPVWSPTGDLIAFVSNRDGRWAIWVINSNGQNPQKLIEVEDRIHTFQNRLDPCIDWSP